MSVKRYTLKVTEVFKYASTLLANNKARTNKFLMGMSNLVEEECRMTILHLYMDIARLIVYAKKI